MALYKIFDRNNIYIYPFYLAEITISKEIEKVIGYKLRESFWTNEKAFVTAYYDLDSAKKLGETIINKIKKDKNFFKEIISNIYKYSEEMMAFCSKVDGIKNVGKLSDKDLLNYYEEYMERTKRLRAWGWVPVLVDGLVGDFLTDHVMDEIRKHLSSIGKEDKVAEVYSIMSSADKSSAVQQEEKARLKIILELEELDNYDDMIEDVKNAKTGDFYKKYPKTKAILERHLKEYGWLPYLYIGPEMSLEYLFEEIRNDLKNKDSIEVQLENLEERPNRIRAEKEKMRKEYEFSSYLNYLFDVSSELMFIKDYRKGIYQKSYLSMDKIMSEIAKRLNISLKEVKYLVYDEVYSALLRGVDYNGIAKERTMKCCYSVKNGEIKVYQGKECEKVIKEMVKPENKEIKDTNELKGAVAYKGHARGIAKVILVKEDVPKLKEGEILISSATNPDLIIAMKRASAIVTDLGGIMSHAAIVSRELKKPAVIGTRIATHLIKDGDELDVDADKGIVKIIKRGKR